MIKTFPIVVVYLVGCDNMTFRFLTPLQFARPRVVTSRFIATTQARAHATAFRGIMSQKTLFEAIKEDHEEVRWNSLSGMAAVS